MISLEEASGVVPFGSSTDKRETDKSQKWLGMH